ncbi:unnamed protein product [Polarella glacialis]|uniref:Uncharacterized protein n=1 Tax=Polarella glacialis TaxID=89957 RepID=A0A813HEP7_POLGL|nr:unnamed protein product [Polarella glacialis]
MARQLATHGALRNRHFGLWLLLLATLVVQLLPKLTSLGFVSHARHFQSGLMPSRLPTSISTRAAEPEKAVKMAEKPGGEENIEEEASGDWESPISWDEENNTAGLNIDPVTLVTIAFGAMAFNFFVLANL